MPVDDRIDLHPQVSEAIAGYTTELNALVAVSYTHLDVYKRQGNPFNQPVMIISTADKGTENTCLCCPA